MAVSYRVKWPAMSVPATGKVLYNGDTVPDSVTPSEREQLVSIGAIIAVDSAQVNPDQSTVPAKSATRPEWETYAVSQGWTAAAAKEPATKADLIAALTADAEPAGSDDPTKDDSGAGTSEGAGTDESTPQK